MMKSQSDRKRPSNMHTNPMTTNDKTETKWTKEPWSISQVGDTHEIEIQDFTVATCYGSFDDDSASLYLQCCAPDVSIAAYPCACSIGHLHQFPQLLRRNLH